MRTRFAVIPRSRRRRGISHCLEDTQSEIPRSARNDSLDEVFTQTPTPWATRCRPSADGLNSLTNF